MYAESLQNSTPWTSANVRSSFRARTMCICQLSQHPSKLIVKNIVRNEKRNQRRVFDRALILYFQLSTFVGGRFFGQSWQAVE